MFKLNLKEESTDTVFPILSYINNIVFDSITVIIITINDDGGSYRFISES